MFEVRNSIHILIILYIIICLGIWYLKPVLMFEDDKIKDFGLGNNRTLFSYQIVTIILALILYYIFEIIWLKKNNFL
tara:strand:+ start:217 stop:447 length:231 start_codon:yes stop_codon:yes gene_type:complete